MKPLSGDIVLAEGNNELNVALIPIKPAGSIYRIDSYVGNVIWTPEGYVPEAVPYIKIGTEFMLYAWWQSGLPMEFPMQVKMSCFITDPDGVVFEPYRSGWGTHWMNSYPAGHSHWTWTPNKIGDYIAKIIMEGSMNGVTWYELDRVEGLVVVHSIA